MKRNVLTISSSTHPWPRLWSNLIHVAACSPLVSHAHFVSLLQSVLCNAKIFNNQPVDRSENGWLRGGPGYHHTTYVTASNFLLSVLVRHGPLRSLVDYFALWSAIHFLYSNPSNSPSVLCCVPPPFSCVSCRLLPDLLNKLLTSGPTACVARTSTARDQG